MAKTKQRTAANPAETATLSLNERILQECHKLYVDEERGLVKLGEELGLTFLAPRKKITVMLIGNHSAGKSSFINWYIEEHVQKTAVAIETQGFTLVTSGKRRESLTGNATLHLFPKLKDLQNMHGVVDYLTTEISTSKQKRFSLVTFIDTPGLVDGDMQYPFDVNETITWLGDTSDLVFVLFDPLGQALCKRTLNIVERLNDRHPDRIRFFLSKADTAGVESDRQRVLMQITQELCKRPGLNKTGFDIPTIYIPNLTGKNPRCENQIDELCREIEKTINHNIQNTLNTLEKDGNAIIDQIDSRLTADSHTRRSNYSARCRGLLMYLVALFGLLLVSSPFLQPILESFTSLGALHLYMVQFSRIWLSIPSSYRLYIWILCAAMSALFLLIAHRTSKTMPTMSRKEKRSLSEKRDYVHSYVEKKKSQLYEEYLKQSVGALDMS